MNWQNIGLIAIGSILGLIPFFIEELIKLKFGKNYYKIRETHHYLIIRIPIKIRVKEYFNIETNTYECACCNPVWYFGYNFKFDKIFTWSKI